MYLMQQIHTETRKSVRKRLSSEKGYTGLSSLHQLYGLYQFNVIKDLVYDVHHNLPLNVIKNQLDRLDELEMLDLFKVNEKLKSIPWTAELKNGHLPTDFVKRRGYWKAEDFQKFCFPASEVIFQDLLPECEFEIWSTVARMTEMMYVCGRDGWSTNMIEYFHNLTLKFNTLVEEQQGLEMCVVTNHNLEHFKEDLHRFSASDNTWCYVFERAVKKYKHHSNNCKGFEITFAAAEARRELLKVLELDSSGRKRVPSIDLQKVS